MPSPSPSAGSTNSAASLVSEGRKSTTSAGAAGAKKFGKYLQKTFRLDTALNLEHFRRLNYLFFKDENRLTLVVTSPSTSDLSKDNNPESVRQRKCQTLTPGSAMLPVPPEFELKRARSRSLKVKSRQGSRSSSVKGANRKSMAAGAVDASKFLMANYSVNAQRPQHILKIAEWKSTQQDSSSSENESESEDSEDSDFESEIPGNEKKP